MSVTISRHDYNLNEIQIQIRQHVLPGLNLDIEQIVTEVIANISPTPDLLAGKSMHQITETLDHFKFQASKELNHIVTRQLIVMLENTLGIDVPPQSECDDTLESSTLLTERTDESDDTIPIIADPQSEQLINTLADHAKVDTEQILNALNDNVLADLPPAAEPMPLCTIRSIIIDRVDDLMIHDILTMHKAKMTPSEIRVSGIALTEEIIETIINDYGHQKPKESKELAPTPEDVPYDPSSPIPGSEHYDVKQRQVCKLFKVGRTIESIAAELRINVDLIEEMTQGISIDDIVFNGLTSEIIKAHKEKGHSVDEIAEHFSLRPEYVALTLDEIA